ncbi:MAG: hypothetical protein IKA41_00590 [Bacteroidaceae bacterium]|nr:hypothetical protein [Bacteroidaceae bacterium]
MTRKLLAVRAHLADNRGDENVSKMIWIAIVFIVGAILLAIITAAFNGKIKTWFNGLIDSWFGNGTNALNSTPVVSNGTV